MKHEECGFQHLHLHSDFSVLDGYGTPDEYAKRWKVNNGQYLVISDHGMMGSIPKQIKACEASEKKDDPLKGKSLHPIFACELYVNPMQVQYSTKDELQNYIKQLNPDEAKKMRKSYHLLAIAYSETGYSNLVRLTSAAWTKGFYYRPRTNHEQLLAHKEGLIFTSCCYNSEIGQAFDQGGEEAGFAMVEKYMAMFGKHFYLELMLLDFNKQKPYDAFIIKAHNKYGIPLIVTNDCHYCNPEDSRYQRLMLMIQTGRTLKDIERAQAEDAMADMFELQDKNLWMKTEQEMNEKWEADYKDVIDYELFKQAKRNTLSICQMAKGVKLDRSNKLPQIENADLILKDEVIAGYKRRGLPTTQVNYLRRMQEEYELICRKGFASYFLIQKKMTDEARRVCKELLGWGDGSEAVGPGRGSAVGSLLCYCLGITDVDPVEQDLLFSRFMSEARGGKQMKLRFTNIDPLPPEEMAAA